ncbi:MAG: IS982 family transposase [Dysgonamonadaceae bacterium]|jgi:hypothetical protein|nr:IS982 family transposase [Dysgonamonadaceae bacterium]
MSILTTDKITEIFCITDDFCKEFSKEMKKVPQLPQGGKRHRNRSCTMSESEIMTILLLYHFGSFKNFKHFYLHYVCIHLKKEFPNALSYNRFIQIEHRVFVSMMFFLNTVCFGKCTGITFVDSTKIAVCNNKRIYNNHVFKELAKRGKSTMGWFYGFKLHLVCNDKGELLSFCLTPGNVDDRNPKTLKTLTKKLFGKLFGDRGYISAALFERLFNEGVHLVTGIKSNMKNRLMPLYDRIMLRKRSVIETINDELKNICDIEHSRHRSIHNFIMNLIAALGAYCFFDKKPAIKVDFVPQDGQLSLF